MEGTGFCIRKYRDGDEGPVVDLLNRVFAKMDPAFVPRDVSWWRWKYADNPAGFHSLVAEDPDGAIVAHYGGVPCRVNADGRRVQFGQNCDTFSDPAVRRGLHNPGLFVRLAQAYASTHGHPDDDAVMYGLPSRDAGRIGARYLDYWPLRSQLLLAVRNDLAFPAADDSVRIEETADVPDDVDELYHRASQELRCTTIRDASFLRWRFTSHPEGVYRLFLARNDADETLRGYAVYRPGRIVGRDGGLLVDWLADPGDDAAAGSLLRAVLRAAWADHFRELFFLLSTSSPWFIRFQDWGFRGEPTPYTMTARPYDSKLEPDYLRDHWHYTLADFDID